MPQPNDPPNQPSNIDSPYRPAPYSYHPFSNPERNGWREYEKLVLSKLETIEDGQVRFERELRDFRDEVRREMKEKDGKIQTLEVELAKAKTKIWAIGTLLGFLAGLVPMAIKFIVALVANGATGGS